jgi:ABC-type hemin transport system ATPase subunit
MAGVELELVDLDLPGRLHTINGQISRGVVTCLVGPNGAGKSRLLEVISGLEQPAHGAVLLQGKHLHSMDMRALARLRAYLPQQINRDLGFSGAQVLGMACYQGQAQSQALLDEHITLFDLAPLLQRPLSVLSGGECQRLQIARTLLQILSVNPHGLILLDEPLAGLDIQYQLRLMQHLRDLAQRGNTVLIALHDINLARLYGHKVWLLEQGHLLASGPARDVLSPEHIQRVFAVPMALAHGQLLWPEPH